MRIHWLLGRLLVAGWVVVLCSASGGAQETDPGRGPTGVSVQPGDLLKMPDGSEFRFGYLPSNNRLRLLMLQPAEQYMRWECVLSRAGSDEPLARLDGPLPMPPAGVTWDIPDLPDGDYALAFSLLTTDGRRETLHRTFKRQHFPWESETLGLDRVILPPFTPMIANADTATIACILREHALAEDGLWKQVTSQGVELLAAPMRLEAEIDGQTVTSIGNGPTFHATAADRVEGQASWKLGPLTGQTRFWMEYDGVARLQMQIDAAPVTIGALRLVIPLRTDEASLMHPVTDNLRYHYAGLIPDGTAVQWEYGGKSVTKQYTETGRPDANGKVWDSRHVERHQLPAPFVPYIWVGGTERGICWFAENDRDWNLDPKRPAMEILRQGDTTSLVIHLINQPTRQERPRTITFGLMATPAKPMPETPANWRRWFAGPPVDGTRDIVNIGFMGACYYWGAAGPCHAFYPIFKDFALYEEFARLRKGGAPDAGYLERWLKPLYQAARDGVIKDPAAIETNRVHVNWSLHNFTHKSWTSDPDRNQTSVLIPYTNARGINWGEEVQTFMDEWSTIDIADPRWPGEERLIRAPDGRYLLATWGKVQEPDPTMGIAYATDPVTSWANMVMHYEKKMFETFADGVYYDDYFLSPNYAPGGPGYIADDGTLRPGVNIFGFRELTRRTAATQHSLGQRPAVFIHMTNANIVPILSYATILLDHEWRDQGDYKQKDAQERLDLDRDANMLLAQSTGLQSGCITVWHNLFHNDRRLNRSALGVSLVHEIKMGLWWDPLHEPTTRLLANFGYGREACRVWRYWDEQQPVSAGEAPVKLLAMARNGRVLIIATSFGPDAEVTLTLDRQALGLGEKVTAVNAEDGAAIERPAPDRLRFNLPRHDFRMIELGPVEEPGGE